tara:strand:+ start:969 stop:1841 length:873 start_codon:yes stop_codon:yes gene_type:complete
MLKRRRSGQIDQSPHKVGKLKENSDLYVYGFTIRSNWAKNVGGFGRPLAMALFTWNFITRRYEKWGHRGEDYAFTSDVSGQDDRDFIGPMPAVGDERDEGPAGIPPLADPLQDDNDDIGDLVEEDDNPWWLPDNYFLLATGFEGDGLVQGDNPQSGHLGLRGRPEFVGAGYNVGQSGELKVGLQCDLPVGGSPYDVGAMVAYHHYFPVGQRIRVGPGGGLFWQVTSDDDAGGQEGNWTGDHHPYGFAGVNLQYDPEDLFEAGGFHFDVGVYVDTERGFDEPFLGFGLTNM